MKHTHFPKHKFSVHATRNAHEINCIASGINYNNNDSRLDIKYHRNVVLHLQTKHMHAYEYIARSSTCIQPVQTQSETEAQGPGVDYTRDYTGDCKNQKLETICIKRPCTRDVPKVSAQYILTCIQRLPLHTGHYEVASVVI